MKEDSGIFEYILKSPRRSKVLILLHKPLLYCEIKYLMRLSKNDRVDELKELIAVKLAACLTPCLQKGRLYDLTPYGIRVRSAFLVDVPEKTRNKLVGELGISSITYEYKKSARINDWRTYAEISVSRKQLRPLLEVIDNESRAADRIALDFRKKTGKTLSTGNLHSLLRRLNELGLAEREGKDMKVFYSITSEGSAVKEQLGA